MDELACSKNVAMEYITELRNKSSFGIIILSFKLKKIFLSNLKKATLSKPQIPENETDKDKVKEREFLESQYFFQVTHITILYFTIFKRKLKIYQIMLQRDVKLKINIQIEVLK